MSETSNYKTFRNVILLLFAASIILSSIIAKDAIEIIALLIVSCVSLGVSLFLLWFSRHPSYDLVSIPVRWNPNDERQQKIVRKLSRVLALLTVLIGVVTALSALIRVEILAFSLILAVVTSFFVAIIYFSWKIKKIRKN